VTQRKWRKASFDIVLKELQNFYVASEAFGDDAMEKRVETCLRRVEVLFEGFDKPLPKRQGAKGEQERKPLRHIMHLKGDYAAMGLKKFNREQVLALASAEDIEDMWHQYYDLFLADIPEI
jgi:hypothetical protein